MAAEQDGQQQVVSLRLESEREGRRERRRGRGGKIGHFQFSVQTNEKCRAVI